MGSEAILKVAPNSVFLYGSYIKTHSRSGYQQLDAGAILKSRHAYRKLETNVFLYGDVSLVVKPRVVIPLS